MPSIPGLSYLAETISDEEENALIRAIDSSSVWSTILRRRVQHYGYRYDYRSRRIDETMRAAPFPRWLEDVGEKLMHANALSFRPDQAIINEYQPGQGIAAHVDCEPCFGPEVASLSLASDCEMQFCNVHTNQRAALFLERRSLVVLRGAARFEWRHGIPARLSDFRGGERLMRTRRISITFRKVILA